MYLAPIPFCSGVLIYLYTQYREFDAALLYVAI